MSTFNRMAVAFQIFLLFICCTGCEEMTGIGEKPRNAPNIIAPGGIDDLAGKPAGGMAQPAVANTPPADDGKGIIGKTTAKVVNAKEALQNPNITVIENKAQGNDPLTFSASAYVSIRSQASTLGMQQAIQAHKALNDRNPTYDEFMKIMSDCRVEFTMLYPYQMYGYDEEKGAIVILQDNAEKAARYKAAGIPLDENDPPVVDPNAGGAAPANPPAGNQQAPGAGGVQLPGLPGRSLPIPNPSAESQ